MRRRDFMARSAALLGAGIAAGSPLWPARSALAQTGLPTAPRTLVNTMLLGGADLRYLFAPEPGSAYAQAYWNSRQGIYHDNAANIALYPNYEAVWQGLYTPVKDANNLTVFGIHRSAGWLIEQFEQGNVAIVCNVLASDNRRHDHSQVVVNSGDVFASQFVVDRDGWGGRLASAIGSANSVAVTNAVSLFCNGLSPDARTEQVVHARDTRNFALSRGNANRNSAQTVLGRALRSYYAEKNANIDDMPADSPYRRFLAHEASLREFGDALEARLAAVAPSQPEALLALYAGASALNSPYFGKQCANIYDSLLASDLLNMRIISAEYGGWDSHDNEKVEIEPKFSDLFGPGGGLNVLDGELAAIPGAQKNLVHLFTSDFGRQISANGTNGCDHGTASYSILCGRAVNGGVYGEMFPEREIEGGPGQSPYEVAGSDIEGRTDFELLMSAVCEWMEPGTGSIVFPRTAAGGLPLEAGVDVNALFADKGLAAA